MGRRRKTKSIDLNLVQALDQATGREAKLALCRMTRRISEITARHIVAQHSDLDMKSLRRAHADGSKERVQLREDRARVEAKAHAEQARAKAQLRAERARVEAQIRAERARVEAQAQAEREILPLTPTKRLDTILKSAEYWAKYRDELAVIGVSWEAVEKRQALLTEKQTLNEKRQKARRDEARKQELEAAVRWIDENPIGDLGVSFSLKPEDRRPVRIKIDLDVIAANIPQAVIRHATYAIKNVFRGCVSDWPGEEGYICLEATAAVFLRLMEDREKLEQSIAAIQELRPGSIELIGTKEAFELSGVPRATFDSAVKAGIIPISDTEAFSKWGKQLVASKFEIRDILELARNGTLRDFHATRELGKASARKQAAERAKTTRSHRAELRIRLMREAQDRRREAVRSTGNFSAAHHLELFEWAQRASRLAKTRPSLKEAAYDLKDDALLALFEADALDVSFVDARQKRLTKKCRYHSKGWHHFDDLYFCSSCRFEDDHYYSLYATRLKEMPNAGGLHIPYPLGHLHGLPDLTKLPAADHDVHDAGGRKLTADEVALFPIDTITKEIERLIGMVALD